MNPVVRRAHADDRTAVVGTIVAAFAADPLLRYLAPSEARYQVVGPAFFGCLFDLRVDGGGEVRITDDATAASLWNPSGGNRLGDAHVKAQWAAQVEPLLDAGERERMRHIEQVLGAMHPQAPHWYLGVAAVHPRHQGRGLGAAVIRALLAEPEVAAVPAFLITAKAGNVPLYQRIGFEVVCESDLPAGPHLWGMQRPAG